MTTATIQSNKVVSSEVKGTQMPLEPAYGKTGTSVLANPVISELTALGRSLSLLLHCWHNVLDSSLVWQCSSHHWELSESVSPTHCLPHGTLPAYKLQEGRVHVCWA